MMGGDSPRNTDLIYLTGFMASGKSTIGPILANTLGFEFADLDRLVEALHGKSVKRIFMEDGEAFFRDAERQLLTEISTRHRYVISLGGGTLTDPGNFALIRASGLLVYLHTSPEELIKRLRHKADRPVLTDTQGDRLSPERLRARVLELYRQRSPLYDQAHIRVPTDGQSVGITVDSVVKKLKMFVRSHPAG